MRVHTLTADQCLSCANTVHSSTVIVSALSRASVRSVLQGFTFLTSSLPLLPHQDFNYEFGRGESVHKQGEE